MEDKDQIVMLRKTSEKVSSLSRCLFHTWWSPFGKHRHLPQPPKVVRVNLSSQAKVELSSFFLLFIFYLPPTPMFHSMNPQSMSSCSFEIYWKFHYDTISRIYINSYKTSWGEYFFIFSLFCCQFSLELFCVST